MPKVFIKDRDKIRKILILGHSNIGDVCYDLSILRPLREYFKNAKISFLTSPKAQDILTVHQGIDEIIILDKRNKHKGLFRRIAFSNFLRRQRFDLVIILNSTLMHIFLNCPYVWDIYHSKKSDFDSLKKHPVDIYFDYLRARGLKAGKPEFNFSLEFETKFCESFLKKEGFSYKDKLVGIMPISAWAAKNWPLKKWNTLATQLKQYGVRIVALGKASGDAYSENVVKNISPDIISAINKTTLPQALALITYCDIFIGPDSSFLHLASCLGVESIGLYGPTPVDYVYPYFHRQNIICSKDATKGRTALGEPSPLDERKSNSMDKISGEEVLSAVKSKLNLT